MPNGFEISRETFKDEQEEIEITPEKIKKILRKMRNWKAPGPDFV